MVYVWHRSCDSFLGAFYAVRSSCERVSMHTSIRGTGITTEQMKKAPKDAIYVWVNHHFDYPRALARKLGRDDLRVVSPSFLEPFRTDGLLRSIVLDHATILTRRQCEEYEAHCVRYKTRFDSKERKT